MINLSFKQKIIAAVVTIGLILIAIFQRGFGKATPLFPTNSPPKTETSSENTQVSEEPKLLSTNPSPLNNAVILPTQTIELTFNTPLENRGELKFEIKPQAEVEVSLSNDKKTAKITPTKPYTLGQTYTINIKNETKFDNPPAGRAGKKRLPDGLNFTFKTIDYRGV